MASHEVTKKNVGADEGEEEEARRMYIGRCLSNSRAANYWKRGAQIEAKRRAKKADTNRLEQ